MDDKLLDDRFAVTIDDVVARAVGFEIDNDEIDAIFILKEELENAQADLDEAKAEGRTPDQLQKLEAQLATSKQNRKLATAVRVSLLHEVDEARQSGNGDVHIISADKQSDYPRLRTHSVFNWLQSKFGISIPEWAPPEKREVELSVENSEDTAQKKPREDLIKNYQRVVEGLVALLLEGSPAQKYLKQGNIVNQKKIADEIARVLEPHPRNEEVPATRTIQKKLTESGVGQLTPPKKS